MRFPTAGERGSVAAEFAVVVPAAILVLAGCLAALHVTATQVRVQDAAASAARASARGDDTAGILRSVPGASLATAPSGDLICASVTMPAAGIAGVLTGLTLSATSCALDAGR